MAVRRNHLCRLPGTSEVLYELVGVMVTDWNCQPENPLLGLLRVGVLKEVLTVLPAAIRNPKTRWWRQ